MEREKMLDLWKKEFEQGYISYNFPPTLYDYFEGKIDQPFGEGYYPRKNYASYEGWMLKELDGENDELARRMLYVISLIRSQGLIYQYNIENDLNICLRLDWGFETILKGLVRVSKEIDLNVIYTIAKKLEERYPQESQTFADKLLSDQLEPIASKRKTSCEFYLMLYMAVVLAQKEPSESGKYQSVILEQLRKYKGKYMVGLSYYARNISPEINTFLIEQINTNVATTDIWDDVMNLSDLLPFLKQQGAQLWSYYYLVMKEKIDSKNRHQIINNLFREDKETFMQLYERLTKGNAGRDLTLAGYLLAIMKKNGMAPEEEDKGQLILSATLKGLCNEYSEKSVEGVTDETIPLEDIESNIEFRNFWWGTGSMDYIQVAALLYDYYPKAHRLFAIIFRKSLRNQYNYHNSSITACRFVASRKLWLDIPMEESLKTLLQPETGYTMQDIFRTYCFTQSGYTSNSQILMFEALMSSDIVKESQQMALDLLNSGDTSIEDTLTLLDLVYNEYQLDNNQTLLKLLGNKSKQIRKKAEELIFDREESVRAALEAGIEKSKGEARLIAKRLIKRWDNERKYGAEFTLTTNQMVIDFCMDNYDEDNSRFISWIPEDMLMDIRFADLTEKAPVVVMKYLLSEYLSLEESVRIKICDKVTDRLCCSDLQAAFENIYRLWMDNGAEAKKKMFMVPYCMYASDSQILKLKTQLKDWAEASRGAIAAFVVNAIALNGGSVALMMIDGISIKFPNNQVKNAAKAAFSFAAKALEIPEDELSDKIVPALGFNKEGEKVLDYGSRTFKVTLMPDFTLSIYDNDKQKAIKSMPSPGANDDTIKATAAKKEFSELKKQIKATVQSQTNRLEKVLMNGRQWNVSAWETLFVENPVMHRFAMGLIWGVYKDGKLTDTFRYMEDGTFNTVDEEEYTLPEEANISLVHPAELPADLLAQWKEQLDDYEVIQPLVQLTAPVVEPGETDIQGKKLMRYNGEITQSGKIAGIARKNNMVRGEILDGGSFTAYHWVDKYLDVAVLLQFEYMWMGQEYNESVTLGEVICYRLGEDETPDDEPNEKSFIDPSTLPVRFISTILGTFDQLIEK